ncbi:cell wall protein PhiA [Ophiocordyceps camponoti-floridani]|uniref:Cell wall protein PhiA n=1 Tax=Ophiocordyceps camponoti-floridani TaxID=2030778 RepID=A0A8H4Q906_9HYPO|nr:cell wall protein PhiA [Ophiocordyceps camponoti-floridani]
MKLSTVVATAMAVIGSAEAQSDQAKSTSSKPFQLMSLRSASDIHFGQISASESNIFINLPDQKAVCKGQDPKSAIFYMKDSQLLLYTGADAPVQRIFVDRSGTGQGKMGYLTGNGKVQPPFEVTGWNLRNIGKDQSSGQALYFNDKSLIACPGDAGKGWTVWVATDNQHPGGNQGCLGFTARVIETANPVACQYRKMAKLGVMGAM